MSDYVRVRQHKTGHELSVPRSHAEATGGYEVLEDRPAVDSAGNPLPPKYRTTVDRAAKQNRRDRRAPQTPAADAAAPGPTPEGQQADDIKEND